MASSLSSSTVADRLEIIDVLHAWTDVIDRGLWDRYEDLFTADARIDFTSIGSAGTDPASHREYLEHTGWPATRAQQHLTGNTIFEELTSSHARTRTSCLASIVAVDGSFFTIGVWYLDELRKENGRWKIASRVCEKNFYNPETWVNPAQAGASAQGLETADVAQAESR